MHDDLNQRTVKDKGHGARNDHRYKRHNDPVTELPDVVQERHCAALPSLGRTESGKPAVILIGLPSIRGHDSLSWLGLVLGDVSLGSLNVLLVNEKKWALRFLGSAIPLFLLGSVLGYWVLPKGIALMLNFTPHGMGITNLLDMNAFLALEIRVILLFGVSFLLPVVLVLLNLIHVLSSAQLKAARKWSIFGFFCLGAFVNPSGDPISMCALAIPLSVMYVIAEWICRSNERKRSTDNMGIDKSEFDIQID